MKTSQAVDLERELFFSDMTERLGDRVCAVEMVCIEANDSTWDFLKVTPPGNQKELWGLLIFCEQSIHFYAHSTESPIMGMFRAASSRKPPSEQLLSFSAFTNWTAEPHVKRSIFGKKIEKYSFLVRFPCETVDATALESCYADKSAKNDMLLIMRTQIKSATILHKMQAMQTG